MTMKNFNFSIIITAVLFFLLSGCGNKNKEEQVKISAPPVSESMNKEQVDETKTSDYKKSAVKDEVNITGNISVEKDKNISVTGRMIIKTGSVSLEVDKFDETSAKISETVKRFGGYTANSTSTQTSSGLKQGTITVKVPADKYDALVSEIAAFGKVMSQNIQANDVTEEYIDLESRQKTQKELEQRLLKLLAEKTARLTDVVEVEEKLASVRQKIESVEGRMRFLRSQSEMSTLTISVYEPTLLTTSSGGGFFYELGQAVKKGLRGFTDIFAGLITIIIAASPLIVFVIIIIFIVRRIFKKRKLAKS
ncbi:DUF4349 domain-containing protein [bacterium]|nr:MAG: DUF4349 domain-containing protein [bacterium]